MLSRIIASVRYCRDGVKGVRFCHGGGVKGTKSGVVAEFTPSSIRFEIGITCPTHCQSNPKPTKRSSSAQPKRQYRKFDPQTSNLRCLVGNLCVDLYFAHVDSRGGKCERGYVSGLVSEINTNAPALGITYYDMYNRIGKIKRRGKTTTRGKCLLADRDRKGRFSFVRNSPATPG